LSSINANGSTDGTGVYLVNISGVKGVSLNSVIASSNEIAGVYMQNITGSASLSGVTASSCTGSGCNGVYLNNIDGGKGVNFKTVVADGNDGDNVYIYDIVGDVNLKNVSASDSVANEGVYISIVGGARGVSLKTVTAVGNYDNNIRINNVNPGGMVLSSVTANESDANSGLYISQVAGTVMIMKSTFNNNDIRGITAITNSGLFALNGVQGNNNLNYDGAYLESDNNLLVCSSEFIGNGLSGTTAYGINGFAPGYSLTIAGTDLSGPPANLTGTATVSGGTDLHENESTKCKVIPFTP